MGKIGFFAATGMVALTVSACASGGTETAQQVAPPQQPINWSQSAQSGPTETAQSASLWTTAPNALLGMRRAKDVGDLLTVVVDMNDQANVQTSLSRNRSTNEQFNLGALFGLPQWANGVLPGGATLSPGVDYDRTSALTGNGAVNRAEQVTFRLSARVVGVEPNGNLIIAGYQQTQVSNEIRYLTVSGVIRSQDITRTNTVSYEKIADANLSYLSQGETMAGMKRGLVPRVLETVLPF
ncbi:MAG: flagellar basal body L-ring protein FlgH [Hyphomonadaceae bacterium]|nr:flagellar basal body L-ring protein FlgH [Hyphomonadaceae bacterium]